MAFVASQGTKLRVERTVLGNAQQRNDRDAGQPTCWP